MLLIIYSNLSIYFLSGNIGSFFVLEKLNAQTFVISLTRDLIVQDGEVNSWILYVDFISPENFHTFVKVNIFAIDPPEIPIFQLPSYNLTVDENLYVGAEVVDIDILNENDSDTIFEILQLNNNFPFHIEQRTGNITVVGEIDYEIKEFYKFYVQVTSYSSVSIDSSTVEVQIFVNNVNDNSPQFRDELLYSVNVSELIPVGSYITKVEATDGDLGHFGEVKYFLYDGNNGYTFMIDRDSGVLSVNSSFDYEVQQVYELMIGAEDGGGKNDSIEFLVYVENVNEHKPKFHLSEYVFFVDEDQEVQSMIGNVEASDSDLNAHITYNISTNMFVDVNETNGTLILINNLDYETARHHTFVVEAFDGRQTATAHVIVHVGNIDDNFPEINPKVWETNVLENANIGTTVAGFVGSDRDGSVVQFSIYPRNYFDILDLGDNSSRVIVMKQLNYFEVPRHNLVVSVTDFSGKNATANLVINILNVYDESFNFDASIYSFSFYENETTNSIVGNVSASCTEGSVTYFLDNESNPYFLLDSISGEFILTQSVDFEQQSEYRLFAKARCRGNNTTEPSREAFVSVIFSVLNVNEFRPNLSIPRITMQNDTDGYLIIDENLPFGTIIANVEATDKDGDSLIFYLNDNETSLDKRGLLGLNSETRSIYVAGNIDRESIAEGQIEKVKIFVSDGTYVNFINMLLLINDLNDNRPIILNQDKEIYVPENTTTGTIIFTVSFTDDDASTIFSVSSFSILSADELSPFTINSTTGNVSLIMNLDYETKKMYIFYIKAENTMGNTDTTLNSNFVQFSVYVTNVEDESPLFTRSLYHSDVIDTAPVGFTVLRLYAMDKDGPNIFMYKISEENSTDNFDLNTFGDVIVKKKLSAGDDIFSVEVSNEGSAEIDKATVSITIVEGEKNACFFNAPLLQSTLIENTPAQILFNLSQHVSNDGALNITFSIESNNITGFTIDSSSGEFSTTKPFDYEQGDYYGVIVQIACRNSITSEMVGKDRTLIQVKIENTDDEGPKVITPLYNQISIPKNTPILKEIGYVVVQDADSQGDATFTFVNQNTTSSSLPSDVFPGASSALIQNEDPGTYFTIISENLTGRIYLTSPIDPLSSPFIELYISAKDPSGNVAANNIYYNISLTPVNDKPMFLQESYNFSVHETETVGAYIGTVEAIDNDPTFNNLTYSITGNPNLYPFEINELTGNISVSNNIDFETQSTFHVTVTASDNSPQQLSSYASVYIYVINDNEHVPVFLETPISFEIYENEVNSSVLYTLRAFDADFGSAGQIYFSIDKQPSLFKVYIGPKSGEIILTEPPHSPGTDNMVVRVTEKDNSAFFSTVSISVTIIDINNHSPVFDQGFYEINVTETIANGTLIYAINATDSDKGNNANIIYRIISAASIPFRIDQYSGELFINGFIDFETENDYLFIIEASDQGTNPLTSSVLFRVKILDQNDNSPVITTQVFSIQLSVETLPGTPIFQVRSYDRDSGPNGEFSFSLVSGNENDVFFIVSPTGSLVLTRNFERSFKYTYNLVVALCDLGQPRLCAKNNASITVTFVNSSGNAPHFPQAVYLFNVTETNDPTQIPYLLAVDNDTPQSQLTYTLKSSNDIPTILYPNGSLWTNGKLDYEVKPEHILIIEVSDNDDPPGKDQMQVVINVINIDDEKPYFVERMSNQVTVHRKPSNQYITTILGNDPDQLGNSLIFKLQNLGNIFQLNSEGNSGILFLKMELECSMEKSFYLNISLEDNDGNISDDILELEVSLIEENLHCPQVQQLSYDVSINEREILQNILSINASDLDCNETFNMVTYSIGDSHAHYYFGINAENGTLNLINPLDFENRTHYQFTVQASDGYCTSTSSIFVTVNDLNDNTPYFVSEGGPIAEVMVNISENLPIGTTVYQVRGKDKDKHTIFEYEIVNQSAQYFNISNISGAVSIAQIIDRESVSHVELWVTANDGEHVSLPLLLNMTIEDVNDNKPNITNDNLTITVSEAAENNSILFTVSASDRDVTEIYKEVEYAIINTEQNFPFIIDVKNGSVQLISKLDYETKNIYEIIVKVKNKNSASMNYLNDIKVFKVKVQDVNDENPTFTQPHYEVSLVDAAPVGFTFLTFMAADKDGPNDFIYSFGSETTENVFGLNPEGELYVQSQLPIGHFTFSVNVTNNGSTEKGVASVSVTVIEGYNKKTVCEFLSLTKEKHVPENETLSMNLFDYVPANLSYAKSFAITGGDYSIFMIDTTNGYLYTNSSFDYEMQALYTLTVHMTCTKNATSEIVGQGKIILIIHISDRDDEAPTILSPLSNEVILSENTELGYSLGRVYAQDVDSQGDLLFSFFDNSFALQEFGFETYDSQSYFSIISNNSVGSILLTRPLNITRFSYLELHIYVTDSSLNIAKENVTFKISVIPANNCTPSFMQNRYHFSINETNITGTYVGQIRTSENHNVYCQITYEIITNTHIFRVNETTGEIFTNNTIDFEIKSLYTIVIAASDVHDTQLNSFTIITIQVLDVNEFFPVILETPIMIYLSENTLRETIIYTLTASDKDNNNAGELSYVILKQPARLDITLNSTSGELVLKETPNFFGSDSMQVRVQNKKSSEFSGNETINFTIIDVNNHPPKFNNRSYKIDINETSNIGTIIFQNQATDLDNDTNSEIKYTILSITDLPFNIDESNGSIFLNKTLDYEMQKAYLLVVEASDNGPNKLTSSYLLYINVIDKNDNEPQFLKSNYTIQLSVDSIKDSIVVQVTAYDKDSGQNGALKFSLLEDWEELFSIDSSTGIIKLQKEFNQVNSYVFNLKVSVCDLGKPPLCSKINSTINLTFVNTTRLCPHFPVRSYLFNVEENLEPTVIPYSSAVEADTPQYLLRYTIIAGADDRFILYPNGTFLVEKPLDFETKSKYCFVVQVEDNEDPFCKDQIQININVININDEKPYFSERENNLVYVGRNDTNKYITAVYADDPDQLDNSLLFRLKNHNDKFQIKSEKGIGLLFLKDEIGCSFFGSFLVHIGLKDNNNNTADNDLTLNVTIQEKNLHCPNILKTSYNMSIDENVGFQQNLFTINSKDLDCAWPYNSSLFNITEEDAKAFFDINPQNGSISLISAFDFESVRYYHFTVMVSDGFCFSIASLYVYINNINDNLPYFVNGTGQILRDTVLIPENLPVGTIIYHAQAVDMDSDTTMIFDKVSTSQMLDVDKTSGTIFISKKIDKEEFDKIQVIVSVTDGKYFTNLTLDVFIDDVNDNRPVITNNITTFEIHENETLNAVFLTVTVKDYDATESFRKLEFELMNQGEDFPFAINSINGNVSVVNGLDYEKTQYYDLVIKVKNTDISNEPLSTIKIFKVIVLDVNDENPKFVPSSYEALVLQSAPVGFRFLTLRARDKDGPNVFSFILVNPNDTSLFNVTVSGEVIVAQRLLTGAYGFQAQVFNDGSTQRDNATITVIVQRGYSTNCEFLASFLELLVTENNKSRE